MEVMYWTSSRRPTKHRGMKTYFRIPELKVHCPSSTFYDFFDQVTLEKHILILKFPPNLEHWVLGRPLPPSSSTAICPADQECAQKWTQYSLGTHLLCIS